MDQIKIGRFIADERKRKGYTQKQLSEKLEISDKTISKWERGNGFPEVSLLLPLCNELYYQQWQQVLQLLLQFHCFCCQECLRWRTG